MKKQIRKSVLASLLALAMLLGMPLVIGADQGPLDMAYNIYSNPVFKGEKAFDTFMIEMKSDLDPDCTYWSLANFSMYISPETRKEYRDITAGGAYAGLQHAGAQRKAIMAFWEWHYWPNGRASGENETNLVAECIYPGGGTFGGEGEGANCIKLYPWTTGEWYRMVLHTWTDPVRGTTYCGQWVQNVATGEYTLISYFDTKMRNSYLMGDMSFFMENFYGINAGEERDVKLKNIYVKQHSDKKWVSVNSSELSHCNNWANNKTGNHSFGATDEYFWGKSGGFIDADKQAALDKSQKPTVYTIKQHNTPSIGDVAFKELQLRDNHGQKFVRWYFEEDSTPQLYYRLKCTDVDGKVIYDQENWAPEDFYHVLEGVTTDAYLCEMTVTDIFGQSKTVVNATEAYLKEHPDAPVTDLTTPDAEGEGTEGEGGENTVIGDEGEGGENTVIGENDSSAKKGSNTTVLIVCVSVGGAVAVIAAVAVALVLKKKKKK
ncbi:MAG: DUF3472 domain-containing protein [Ruminococcaceae bacterium]|nr:DUF3472 domain-containing protein [Oscillospiraceae bacterium]